jgi:hypothetical protein
LTVIVTKPNALLIYVYVLTNKLPRLVSDVITPKYFAQPCGISLNFGEKEKNSRRIENF